MNRNRFWLTVAHFSKIEPHLPTDTRGKARVDDRRVISGIVQVLKASGRWVDAPPEYGPRKTLCNRFVRWAEKGVWTGAFHALTDAQCRPPVFMLTGGQVTDCTAGAASLERLPDCDILRADKGYDANSIRRQVEERGAMPNIPPKANRNGRTASRRSFTATGTPSSACSAG